ncbi:MAG: hypothetical protein U1E73_00350 [Planctomycetota bacterium]
MEPTGRPALAIDAALEVGRTALGKLRRLRGEIADAQAAEGAGWRFWPIAVLAMFGQHRRRRQIREMTAELQNDLAALDAAVDSLREAGVRLPEGAGVRAASATRTQPPPAPWAVRRDPWRGPMQVVEGALSRVERILDVLRQTRG